MAWTADALPRAGGKQAARPVYSGSGCRGQLLHQLAADTLGKDAVAALSGPSFASDVAKGLPTAVSLAAASMEKASQLAAALSRSRFRIYATDDLVGVEIGGALKNVLALAVGIARGLQLGASAEAALIARGFAELSRVANAQGARSDTLAGLSGLGDLTLTSTSNLSRNYCHGLALGGAPTGNALDTVEGIATADATARLAGKLGLDLPVCLAINLVCKQKLSITEAVTRLMTRPLKEE